MLAAASAAFGILLLEIGLRLAGYQAIYDVYSKPSIFWEYDPVLGWAHTPGSEATYVGPRPWPIEFSTPIRINSQGLRGPEIDPLPPMGVRVLLQGDSRVAAFEVAYEDTFGARLETGLSEELGVPVQVINAGVRGYGTDQSYLYFLERGHEFNPDLVIHVHSGNDTRNNVTIHRMRRPFAKAAFALTDGELELRGAPVSAYPLCSAYRMGADFKLRKISSRSSEIVCGFQMLLADRSALFTLLTLRLVENRALVNILYGLGSPTRSDLIDQKSTLGAVGYETRLTRALIRAFSDAVEANGSNFLLFTEQPGSAAKAIAPEDIEVLDLSKVLEGVSPRSVGYQNDGHFNEQGHRLIAEYLTPRVAAFLRERGIPPESPGPE